jgi:hypothetical protein
MEYQIIKIPKKKNQFRLVYSVDDESKKELKQLLPYLEKIHNKLDKKRVNYAFLKGKNCILNALQHIGYNYTLSLDLENFFDSVNPYHLKDFVSTDVLKKCLIDGTPKQGLPTSPLLASIAFIPYDEEINSYLKKLAIKCVYTRYADDLTFSFNNFEDSGKIQYLVNQVLRSSGFKLNPEKSKLQNSKNGRIIITGIGVDKTGIYPTRKIKKRIRAADHQRNIDSLNGLLEWEKCKLPNAIRGENERPR